MKTVEEQFGAPREPPSDTVGKPPITRWDYPGFSVFFEKAVIHAVATSTVATGSWHHRRQRRLRRSQPKLCNSRSAPGKLPRSALRLTLS